jgi:hypothetical protein
MNMNSLYYRLEGIITKKLPCDSGGATRIGSSVREGRETGEAGA